MQMHHPEFPYQYDSCFYIYRSKKKVVKSGISNMSNQSFFCSTKTLTTNQVYLDIYCTNNLPKEVVIEDYV